ncbi:MAG: hypothetical protein NC393_09760 [Clostridium sp.]|nr:hypothetical protein [Clostridium sp.]MCM1172398.1 hypothetical protein [Clostridium sp.]
MGNLKVSYAEIDNVISELRLITNHPEDIYITLGRLNNHFSTSNSDMANKMVATLSRYREAYDLMLDLCRNSVNMLTAAKYLYEDMDVTQSEEIGN